MKMEYEAFLSLMLLSFDWLRVVVMTGSASGKSEHFIIRVTHASESGQASATWRYLPPCSLQTGQSLLHCYNDEIYILILTSHLLENKRGGNI